MVTLQKSEECKNYSNRVKITYKWKSLQKSEFHFFRGLT